jgi:hypothetical protein
MEMTCRKQRNTDKQHDVRTRAEYRLKRKEGEARPAGVAWSRATTMEDIRFDRQFRTPYSESYAIMQGNSRVGSVDIHFTTTTVHGTLILERELEESEIAKLIEQIDEDLVWSADMSREDFLVSVYVGKDVGFYSDDYFDEDEDEEDDFELEIEDEDNGNGKH